MKASLNFVLGEEHTSILNRMCKVELVDDLDTETLVRPLKEGNIYFAANEIVDIEKEIAKIKSELADLEKEIKRSNGILSNPNFLNKAPKAKVDLEKDKLVKYENSYHTLKVKLAEYEGK